MQLLRGVAAFFTSVHTLVKNKFKGVSGAARSRGFQAKPLNTGSTDCETIQPVFQGLA